MDKYTEKKRKNQALSKLIGSFVSEASAELIAECNTFMMFASDERMEKMKQHKGNSCKNRFCPICSWRKAKKDALALSVQMKYIEEEHQKDFIFMTLTAPNVSGEDLLEEIRIYNKAFKKMVERKEVKTVVKGYVRKLEVTYNKERDDYHPHFHVLITVNKSYFTQTKQYISRDRWLELWQQATGDPTITQVDVRKVRKNNNKEISEIAKYVGKDSDYLSNEKVFEAFYKSLKGKQLVVYSGLFKESMKLFKNGDLDKYREVDPTEYVYALMYNWGQKEYILKEKRELTEDERKQLNRNLLDEVGLEE
ncbi:protein rep [Cytobacillus sp. Sa5YUA1]|uniref:Protein rep n=1 Tax=Cytobacillus stercorigallinarum TaxID=2762240 RepID=A0ABR8QW78_9BACI|nr:protein rep [Cytobacillus stercorigallinarum]MBC9721285.1 protein rep [Lactobacillus sp.]MBD7939758.1 protein rep [Cytobacillus stercorigallinarum]